MPQVLNLTEDEKYFAAHITDLAAQCRKQGVPKFSGFLTPRELAVARGVLMGEDCFVFGGAPETERNMIGIFTESYACYDEDKSGYFPIKALTYTYRKADRLSHRDFLGCILSLGIKRELLGDIFVGEGYAVVFAADSIIDMLMELEKVGSVGVTTEKGMAKELLERRFERLDGVVSSLRLDCIVAFLANMSREKTSQLIKSGMVQLGGTECTDTDESVDAGSIISIRGSGKYRLTEIGAETRKGRTHIVLLKYI